MDRVVRRSPTIIALIFAILIVAIPTRAVAARAAPADSAQGAGHQADPRQILADRYAPIAMLRQQRKACDRDGEGYSPAPVEVVLGNPEVALKRAVTGSSKTDPIVMMGPTAQDLAGKDETYYLDFPGNPRRVGCTFERTSRRYAEQIQAEPTTYAHIVVDLKRRQLVLQYWLWYYFNDWNNTHESDWEMIQLVFEATTVEQALATEPARVGFAQHGGGETAAWDDDKLAIAGGHPVIHPAAGSHSTHYGYEYYIGWGENGTGFGCDSTYRPARRVPLNAVLVPDNPDPNGPFAWLLFKGRWGERQTWEFNGPNGPPLGQKWIDPIGAMENWRSSSLKIPDSNALGPTATDLFCTLSAQGSRLVIRLERPWIPGSIFLAMIGAVFALFVVKRHELGEAYRFYRRHLRVFAGIGTLSIPIGIAYNGFAILVRENPPVDWVMQWLNDTAGARLAAALTVGGLQQASMVLLVAPPVIYATREILGGRQPEVIESMRGGYRHIGALIVAALLLVAVLGLLVIFVVGLPLAVWLAVRWQFFVQATVLEDGASAPEALRRSAFAVTGRWWQALGDSLVFQLLAIIPGPLVGVLLMLAGRVSVNFANSFSSVVYAFTVPVAYIGLTFAYLRYREHQASSRPVIAEQGLPAFEQGLS